MSWKMSLKRPSYFLRMVFLVLIYSGSGLLSAILKLACAKPVMDSSVLYCVCATPPPFSKSYTLITSGLPPTGVKTISSRPLLRAT